MKNECFVWETWITQYAWSFWLMPSDHRVLYNLVLKEFHEHYLQDEHGFKMFLSVTAREEIKGSSYQ